MTTIRIGLWVISTLVLVTWSFGSLLVAQENASPQVELVVTTDVADREPVASETEGFSPDVGELVAWTRITGAANTTVEHVWTYQDNEVVIPLEIGGSPWRTWSRKTIPATWTGEWRVEVRDASGSVLADATFTIGGSPQ